ncbi:rRNA maturation RNase YbeY [Pseudofulvibacter geojedonensis]|uniref:Endoribonuclease YbeY n=1 Tax=Pseudofulvibacter geojedonensis TaxID=1123758 RepID=A0ABW3I444_9FLAO
MQQINFHYENDFSLENESQFTEWIKEVITSEDKKLSEINYIFCDDEYLHKINLEFLNHDTYTDIITFDNCVGNNIQSDIFISTERVADNALEFNVSFMEELKRVMAHGILHLCGYKDKTDQEAQLMRAKENEKINMFHVEQ